MINMYSWNKIIYAAIFDAWFVFIEKRSFLESNVLTMHIYKQTSSKIWFWPVNEINKSKNNQLLKWIST
jgi:hypothetical protein